MLSREKTFKWKVTVLSFYLTNSTVHQFILLGHQRLVYFKWFYQTIQTFLFFFFSLFRHDFLKQQNFKHIKLVAGHKEHSHSFLCVVLVFCTRPM